MHCRRCTRPTHTRPVAPSNSSPSPSATRTPAAPTAAPWPTSPPGAMRTCRRSRRCTLPPTSRPCRWRPPRSSCTWRRCGCCLTGWWLARSRRATRPVLCAVHRIPSKKGKTPVLAAGEARSLLDVTDTSTPVGSCDRALIGLMVYTFARVGTVINMSPDDPAAAARTRSDMTKIGQGREAGERFSGGGQRGRKAPLQGQEDNRVARRSEHRSRGDSPRRNASSRVARFSSAALGGRPSPFQEF